MADAPVSLPDRLQDIILRLDSIGWELDNAQITALAVSLNGIHYDITHKYVELAAGAPYTNAQGVALAKRITEKTMHLTVWPRPSDLPNGWLLGQAVDLSAAAPFTFGVDPNGRVSS